MFPILRGWSIPCNYCGRTSVANYHTSVEFVNVTLSYHIRLCVDAVTYCQCRHLGDISNFEVYRSHLPERWCPILTMTALFGERKAGARRVVS